MNINDLSNFGVVATFGNEPATHRFIRHSNGMVEYQGIAQRGIAEGDAAWYVVKMTYDSNRFLTSIKAAPRNSIWTNYASLTYT